MNEAIEMMCIRCTQHDVCQGTGCSPKRTLEEAEQKLTDIMKFIERAYSDKRSVPINEIIDGFYCENCPKKDDCPVEDGFDCPVTNKESFKYFMENYFKE